MYICNVCEETFEEPKIIKEKHPYGKSYAEEPIAVCTHCEETDFQEAKKCERCGNYVPELKEGLCDICYVDMYD